METCTVSTDNDETVDKNTTNSVINDSEQLRDIIINHVASMDNIYFKSQQRGEPELEFSEKRTIVEEILNKSYSMFLSRFGQYLLIEHLSYFENNSLDDSYEVRYYINKLKNTKCKPVTNIQIKNRRYEAMKRLMSEGEYFSVNEMRKRNPLLFDQLLGNFVVNPKNNTTCEIKHPLAHILLDQFEQDEIALLKKSQIEIEMKQAEEYTSFSDSDDSNKNEPFKINYKKQNTNNDLKLWGKSYKSIHTIGKTRWKNQQNNKKKDCNISHEEKLLLINEFTSFMFNNFLQGKDDYNYSEIDNNPEFDDINQCDVDEEEKYFDSESPQEVSTLSNELENDELEKFMNEVDKEIACDNLTEHMRNMNANKMC